MLRAVPVGRCEVIAWWSFGSLNYTLGGCEEGGGGECRAVGKEPSLSKRGLNKYIIAESPDRGSKSPIKVSDQKSPILAMYYIYLISVGGG